MCLFFAFIDLKLTCEGTNMTATFNQSILAYTNPSDVHLLDPNCLASDYGHNQAVVSTDFHLCGTVMEVRCIS